MRSMNIPSTFAAAALLGLACSPAPTGTPAGELAVLAGSSNWSAADRRVAVDFGPLAKGQRKSVSVVLFNRGPGPISLGAIDRGEGTSPAFESGFAARTLEAG